jgi:sec-independent protein translocase protein TatB
MFDFAWSELTVIGVVALIVIGPKDLPKAMRAAGHVIRRGRALAREFQNTFEEVVREAELDEIRDNMKRTMAGLEIAETPPNGMIAPPKPVEAEGAEPVLLQGEHLPVSYDLVRDPNEPIEWLDIEPPTASPADAHPATPQPAQKAEAAATPPQTPDHPPAP